FLYAARVPMHRALREIGRLFGGAFRVGARWCKGLATVAAKRDHEMIVEMGKGDTEAKIGREFHRIEGAFAKELARYPDLHRKLDDVVTKIDADFQECATAAPEAPGWTMRWPQWRRCRPARMAWGRRCWRRSRSRRWQGRRRPCRSSARRPPRGTRSSPAWPRPGRSCRRSPPRWRGRSPARWRPPRGSTGS